VLDLDRLQAIFASAARGTVAEGKRIYAVLQLRVHPTLVALRERLAAAR